MSKQIAAWQTTRERMVYRYLTALQEEDIDTVLDVLSKAEHDGVLEEMLWQVHEVNLHKELEPVHKKVSGELLILQEEHFGRRDTLGHRHATKKFRRISPFLQTLAAVIAVCALVGGFLVVLGARYTGSLVGSSPPSGCFVSAPTPQVHGWLVSVTTLAENDVWAVGGQDEGNSSVPTTLVEHWNGQNWQIVASPNVNGMSNVLVSVTAISATDVWAVGQTAKKYSGPVAQTLIEHWDGQSWQIVPSKNLVQQGRNTLTGIAAVAANDIWAVGSVDQTPAPAGMPHSQALIEHWDGQSWQIVSGLNPGTGAIGSSLSSVVAISKDDIWAVGIAESMPLIEHWDGQAWKSVASSSSLLPGGLTGIASVGANDIWAVGDGVVEHWDGHNWRVVTNDPKLALNGVVALAPNDVWAVPIRTQPIMIR